MGAREFNRGRRIYNTYQAIDKGYQLYKGLKKIKRMAPIKRKNPYPTPRSNKRARRSKSVFSPENNQKNWDQFTRRNPRGSARRRSGRSTPKTPKSSSAGRSRFARSSGMGRYVINPDYSYTWNMKYKLPKLWDPMIKSKQLSTYQYNTAWGTQCNVGSQQVDRLTSMRTFTSNDTAEIFECASEKVLSNVTAATSAIYNDSTGTYQKLLVENVQWTINFTNQSPVTVEFDIYYCLSKVTDNSTYNPKDDWVNGLLEIAGFGTTSAERLTSTIVDAKPTESKLFNTRWKVVKKISYTLRTGEEKQSVLNWQPNRYIDQKYFADRNTVRGMTMEIMTVLKGTPCDDTNGFSTGVVTYSGGKIAGIGHLKYSARMVNTYPENRRMKDNLTKAALGTGAYYSINEGTGVPLNINLATNFA